MVVKKFPKDKQGRRFRLEVAYISPPEITPNPPRIGEPAKIEANVLGFPADTDVEFAVYEPFKLHEGEVDAVSAKTIAEHRGVEAEWTFDYEGKKDQIGSTRFVLVGRVGRMVSISEPFEFVQTFTATLTDEDGDPLANAQVLLRAPGREDIPAVTDAEGKLELDVPPADYIVEVLA